MNNVSFQAADLNKDESNIRSESKPIATQIQLMNNPEIVQVIKCCIKFLIILCFQNLN